MLLLLISTSLFLTHLDNKINDFSDIKNASIIVALLASFLLIILFLINKSPIVFNKITVTLLCFCLLISYSVFQRTGSFSHNTLYNTSAYFFFYFTLSNYFSNAFEKAKSALKIFLVAFTFTTLSLSFYHSHFFLNTGVWGNYLAAIFPILYISLLTEKEIITKRIIAICFVFCLFLIALSSARADWFSVLITSLLISYQYISAFKTFLNRQNKFILLVLTLVFISCLIYFKYRSFVGRLLIYKICFQIILANLFGTGIGTFQSVFHIFQADYFKKSLTNYNEEWFAADSIRIAYNEYLECFVELGVVGFLLILALVYQLFRPFKDKIRFSKDILSLSAMYSLIGCAIVALFSYPLMEKPICFLLLINLAYLSAKCDNKIELKSLFISKTIWTFLCVFCILITIKTAKKQVDYFHFSLIADATLKSDFNKENYELIYPEILDNSRFLYHYGGELMQNDSYERSIEVLETAKGSTIDEKMFCFLAESYYQKGNYAEAEKNYLLAVYAVPSRFFPKYFLMLFYEKMDRINDAKYWADFIVNMPVKVKSSEAFQIKNEAKRVLNNAVENKKN